MNEALSFLGTVFLVMSLVFNIMPKLPRFPWDVYINKFGFRIYIPVISSLILSVILALFFNFVRK